MAFIFGMGATEIALILIIALIVLGPQKLPEIAFKIGRAFGDLKNATGEFQREFMRAQHEFNQFRDETLEEVRRGTERPEGNGAESMAPQPRIQPPAEPRFPAPRPGLNGPAFQTPKSGTQRTSSGDGKKTEHLDT